MSLQDDSAAVGAALLAALQGPAEVTGDAGSVKAQNLKDLIEVDRYFAAKAAASQTNRGLYFTKLQPPGASGNQTQTSHTPFP